jgi:glucose-6-phosphate 1-epimerase
MTTASEIPALTPALTPAALDTLNQQFGHPGRIDFSLDPQGLVLVQLQFEQHKASFYLQGAHLTSYQPAQCEEVLWVSSCAVFAPGTAIRGGIPLCWPWFGAHETLHDRPQHGFARTGMFEVREVEVAAGYTRVCCALVQLPEFDEWLSPDKTAGVMEMLIDICLSTDLAVSVSSRNLAAAPVTVGAALHTYLRVGDVGKVIVPELKDLYYKDKLRGYEQRRQDQPLVVEAEVDRVYLAPPARVTLHDPLLKRDIQLHCSGNNDLVVWNPGADKALAMKDFDDRGYLNMLCLEPALALTNVIELAPEEIHVLRMVLSVSAH